VSLETDHDFYDSVHHEELDLDDTSTFTDSFPGHRQRKQGYPLFWYLIAAVLVMGMIMAVVLRRKCHEFGSHAEKRIVILTDVMFGLMTGVLLAIWYWHVSRDPGSGTNYWVLAACFLLGGYLSGLAIHFVSFLFQRRRRPANIA